MKKLSVYGIFVLSLLASCTLLRGNKDIQEIRIEFDSNANINYGISLPLDFYAIYSDGKEKKITNRKELTVDIEGGQYTEGSLIIESRPTRIMDNVLKIKAIYKTELDSFLVSKSIPFNYKGDLIIPFSGTPGLEGLEGDGKNTPLLLRNGKDGEHGLDGGNGANGANISAKLWKELSGEFYRIEVTNLDNDSIYQYRFKHLGNSIRFEVNGGSGGKGGDGGKGGNGKDGEIDGDKNKTPGDAGNGGNGGNGGIGGNGGTVYLFLHPNAAHLKEKIAIYNFGGSVGIAGKKGVAGRTGDPDTGQEAAKEGVDGIDGLGGESGYQGEPVQLFIEHFDIE